ncbi:hypothetical protein AOLI_G00186990 [Acnodon oligacanthus]
MSVYLRQETEKRFMEESLTVPACAARTAVLTAERTAFETNRIKEPSKEEAKFRHRSCPYRLHLVENQPDSEIRLRISLETSSVRKALC